MPRRRVSQVWLLLALGLLGACAGGRRLAGPAEPPAVPPAAPPIGLQGLPQHVRLARRQIRAGDLRAALRTLREERGFSALEPERSWLLAGVWSVDGRAARARAEAERLGPGAFPGALRAVLAEDGDAALDALRNDARRDPNPWTHLALALVHVRAGDKKAGLPHAVRAGNSSHAFVASEARLLALRCHLARHDLSPASADAAEASRLDPEDPRPFALLAEGARRRGDDLAAVTGLLDALRRTPTSERYASELASTLLHAADIGSAYERAARDSAWLPRDGSNAEALVVLALLAEHETRAGEAEVLYVSALRHGASPVLPQRRLRRLLARRGDHAGAYRILEASLPPGVALAALNVQRDRWSALASAVAAAPSAAAPPERQLALARAYVGVGALEEALGVAARVPGSDGAALSGRLRGHLAFEAALQRVVEDGYRRVGRDQDPEPFAAVLARIASHAREHLAPEEAALLCDPGRGRREVPVVGAWLDHSAATSSPLVAHFRGYGKFLLVGQREGEPVEAVVLSLASLEPRREIRTRARTWRHDVVAGYDRVTRTHIDFLGQDLSGACLPDGIWLDVDSARRGEHAVRGGAGMPLKDVPFLLPLDTPEGPFAVGDGAGVARRLAARYAARRPGDAWGTWRMLVAHESAHVEDLKHFFPDGPALGPVLSLLAAEGFSPDDVMEELERRAQLAAIAEGPDPDLGLAELLAPLPVRERRPESHDGGYRRGTRDLLRHVYGRPDLYPLDRGARLLPQLHLLSDAQIRQAAAAALREGVAGGGKRPW